MPEGPEVRRAADRLTRTLGGRVIDDVGFGHTRLHAKAGRVAGRVLDRIETRGKSTLLWFVSRADAGAVRRPLVVHVHLGMDGRWSLGEGGRGPAEQRAGGRQSPSTSLGWPSRPSACAAERTNSRA